ncbi:MAG: glycosyltransferase family 1 protein [Aphanocapsa feldmannii 277cV]|uniref:Glycosyltransferase family 1 protein n=1 Tax=Aphanocapsa feldmannii 277cV TaxID=2507553 RepID=A0A524RQK8_9CHRO|nr:MAG: glycosyltransferase family 1 protein [Aphanocapsa feldmannii 277cV]
MTSPLPLALFNGSCMGPRPTRIGVTARELAAHLLSAEIPLLDPCGGSGPYNIAIPSDLCPEYGTRGHLNRLLWTQKKLPGILRQWGHPLLFSPLPEAPLLDNVRSVVLAHDLIPQHFPRSRHLRAYHINYVPKVLHNSKIVLCDSVATAKEIHQHLNIPLSKIIPIKLGFNPLNIHPLSLERHHELLVLGSHGHHKNLIGLLYAFAQVRDQSLMLRFIGPEHDLLTQPLKDLACELGIGSRCIFQGWVDDVEKLRCINQARALILPSLWEGFGLPALEAMACGTPVLASTAGGIPEVVGNAALLFNPQRIEAITGAIDDFLSDSQLERQLQQAGPQQARKFHWAESADQVFEVLKYVDAAHPYGLTPTTVKRIFQYYLKRDLTTVHISTKHIFLIFKNVSWIILGTYLALHGWLMRLVKKIKLSCNSLVISKQIVLKYVDAAHPYGLTPTTVKRIFQYYLKRDLTTVHISTKHIFLIFKNVSWIILGTYLALHGWLMRLVKKIKLSCNSLVILKQILKKLFKPYLKQYLIISRVLAKYRFLILKNATWIILGKWLVRLAKKTKLLHNSLVILKQILKKLFKLYLKQYLIVSRDLAKYKFLILKSIAWIILNVKLMRGMRVSDSAITNRRSQTMKLWLDGQCLQTQRCRVESGFRIIAFLKRLVEVDKQIDLYVSLNAQNPHEAVKALHYLAQHLPMANVQIWEGAVEKTMIRSGSRKIPNHSLSRLSLAHHINCLAPDLALFSNSFEEEYGYAPWLQSQWKIFPEVSKLSCVTVGIFCKPSLFNSVKIQENIIKNPDLLFSTSKKLSIFDVVVIEADQKSSEYVRINKFINLLISKNINLNFIHDKSTIINIFKIFCVNKFDNQPNLKLNQIQINLLNLSEKSLVDHFPHLYVDNISIPKMLPLSEPDKSKMPRFLFDATFTLIHNYNCNTGIQRVIRRLSEQLSSLNSSIEEKVIVFDHKNLKFKEIINNKYSSKNIDLFSQNSNDIMIMLDSNWEILQSMKSELQRFVLHGNQLIGGLHDMIPLHSSGFIAASHLPESFATYFKFILLHSTAIMCVSRAIADELYILLTGINFPYSIKIGFWKLGADMLDISKSDHIDIQSKKCKRLMFISVGTIDIRKGHSIILEAFEKLWNEDWDVELKLVGRYGGRNDHFINKLKRHPELGCRLHWYERLGDNDLAKLYANADALILASYSEGFGLPIAEAGYYGKPVIVSDLPVFREVSMAAPQAFFFAPGSAQELAAQIRRFSHESHNGLATTATPVAWPSWSESMDQLKSVILEDKYYKIYQPKDSEDSFQTESIGKIYTQSYLCEASQKYYLELFRKPQRSQCKNYLDIILFVKNLSDQIYSSNKDLNYKLGVRLGAQSVIKNSRETGYAPIFVDIPFVLLPDHQHIMCISYPYKWWRNGVTFVDLDLLQMLPDGCNWWGQSPLRISLSPQGT